jgi:hypothetical protein
MKKTLFLLLLLQSCFIGIDKDQPKDFFRGEYVVSDNLTTGKIKLGDTITVSYRQSEVFEINYKKCTVYEEDIEKFYLPFSVSIPDDRIEWGERDISLGEDFFVIIQYKGEYNYSRFYPKFDIKTREYIGEFKIVFKKKGVFMFLAGQKGSLKFKDVNALPVIKFNKFPNTIDSMQDFIKDMSEKEKQRWLSSFKLMKQEGSADRIFLRVE